MRQKPPFYTTAAEGFLTIANVDIRKDNKTTVSGLVSI